MASNICSATIHTDSPTSHFLWLKASARFHRHRTVTIPKNSELYRLRLFGISTRCSNTIFDARGQECINENGNWKHPPTLFRKVPRLRHDTSKLSLLIKEMSVYVFRKYCFGNHPKIWFQITPNTFNHNAEGH